MKRLMTEVVEQLAPQCFIDVFASYGVKLTPERRKAHTSLPPVEKNDEPRVAGIVGFTGQKMRGTFVFVASYEVIAAARPSELKKLTARTSSDWILVRDWAGELANQVVGRIKNRLRVFGVTLQVSTPTALSGPELRFAKPKAPATRAHVFLAAGTKTWCWFDAVYDPELEADVTGGDRAAAEGDIILF